MQTIVEIYNRQRDISLTPLRSLIRDTIREVLLHEQVPPTRVTVSFITEKETCSLHELHFNDKSPTDCMSFPVDDPSECALPFGHLGEIYVCPRTAVLQSLIHGTTARYELILYVVHGLLHLTGYDDVTEYKRKRMKIKERYYMNRIVDRLGSN